MYSTKIVNFCFVILVCSVLSVNAIKCYQCNSVTDPGCDKVETLPKQAVDHFYKECEGDYGGSEPFCRKQDIKILTPESTRVIRSCGWIKATERNCLSLDSTFSKGGVCQCFEDGCNSGFSLSSFRLPTLLGIIALIYLARS